MIVSNVVWSPPAPQLALERGAGTGGVLNGCLSGKIPTPTRRLRRDSHTLHARLHATYIGHLQVSGTTVRHGGWTGIGIHPTPVEVFIWGRGGHPPSQNARLVLPASVGKSRASSWEPAGSPGRGCVQCGRSEFGQVLRRAAASRRISRRALGERFSSGSSPESSLKVVFAAADCCT